MLRNELDNIAEEFLGKLSEDNRKNYSPIIKNYFVPYIVDKFNDFKKDAEYIFSYELTRTHIIMAGVKYVDESQKVKGIKSVYKYVMAIGDLYKKVINERYKGNILENQDFIALQTEIANKSKKVLRESQTSASLDRDDFEKIVAYFDDKNSSNKDNCLEAIAQLVLLYGFKNEVIINMRMDDFDENDNVLIIKLEGAVKYNLELPRALSRKLAQIKSNAKSDSEYLFTNREGQQITNSFFYDATKDLKEILGMGNFTLLSMSKYAILNMFKEGINPITVSEITGAGIGLKDDLLFGCLKEAETDLGKFSNRYVNSKIRNIETYDEFN